jgi:hypothetical protein
MTWSRRFDERIKTPDGKTLRSARVKSLGLH